MVNGDGTCNTTNCIYLISCDAKNCHMNYVGFTTSKINKRLAGHRANIINKTEGCFMLDHFTKHHNINNMVIKPIDICNIKVLRAREKYWMQELNTIFPYGLNNRIDIHGIHDAHENVKNGNGKPIYKIFNFVKNNRTKRGSGVIRLNDIPPGNLASPDIFDPETFIASLIRNINKSILKHSRNLIMGLKLWEVHKLLIYVSHIILLDDSKFPYNQYLLFVVKDICLYRITKKHSNVTKMNQFLLVKHVNGFIEDINISKIIHSKRSYECFPSSKDYLQLTGITFKYSPTIRSKVVNYNDTIKKANGNTSCHCEEFTEYVDQHHGHVITGNLDIITNKGIKKLLGFGLNFREKQPLNKEKALSSMQSALDTYILEASNTLKVASNLFSSWKKMILEEVDKVLKDVEEVPAFKVFNQQENKEFMLDFHSKFVVVPVDNAAKNIGIVCKAFYLETLRKEIVDSGNFTISPIDIGTILDKYKAMLIKFNFKPPDIKDLPFIYWIPKFHKIPLDFRYITSGKNTVVNALSKIAGIGLKTMLKLEKTNCKSIHKYDGINNYYIIEDNQEVINFMVKLNLLDSGKKFVKTFDFKTLYTKIPQDKLKDNLNLFVASIFALKNKKFINIGHKYGFFSDKKVIKVVSVKRILWT